MSASSLSWARWSLEKGAFFFLYFDALTRGIPVLAVTATATPVEIEKGLRTGFRHYLTKLLNVVQFLGALESVLAEIAVLRH